MGNIGRRVVGEVGEERELGYFRHYSFNQSYRIFKCIYLFYEVNCVLLWNSEGRFVLKVSPSGRKSLMQRRLFRRRYFRIASAVNSMLGLLWKLNKGCQCSCPGYLSPFLRREQKHFGERVL